MILILKYVGRTLWWWYWYPRRPNHCSFLEFIVPDVQITVQFWSLLSQTFKLLFISEVCCPRRSNHCSYLNIFWFFFKNQKNNRNILVNDRFSSQTPLWQIFEIFSSKILQKSKKWGQNFKKSRYGVHPPDPLLAQFRKAPGSAELTWFCAPTFPSFA